MRGRSPRTLCHPLFPHCGSCPPAAASNKLGTVVAGKGGGGVLCLSLFLILRSEISRTLTSQDRGRQVLCKQVVPGTFPTRTGFFFYYSLETLTLFFFIALLYLSLIEQMTNESTKAVCYTAGNLRLLTKHGMCLACT